MPSLDKSNIHKIVDLLTPFMERENERRALLILALGHDALLLRQLDLTGAVEPFLVNMIKALVDYGEVAPGKQALWALLEVVRDRVGVDRQARIDALYPIVDLLGRSNDQGRQAKEVAGRNDDQDRVVTGIADYGDSNGSGHVDLEIALHRRDADNYTVELRYSEPGSDIDHWLVQGLPLTQFNQERLCALVLDAADYGKCLWESLFADQDVHTAFATARDIAQSSNKPLRLRLFIGPSAPELHSLRWETLCNPEGGAFLSTDENIWFTRYLSSRDWRPVLRPRNRLRALVVIANPKDVTTYRPQGRQLVAVDVSGELTRAKAGLKNIAIKEFAPAGSATLNNLLARLRNGYDILYLVCHGAMIKGEPYLWLENETGGTHHVAGEELVKCIKQLRLYPRLVVLASCQSAGDGIPMGDSDYGTLAALGPRLAEAGIPAVLAMQGSVAMDTVKQFMPAFFEELQKHGQIDKALTVARSTVRQQSDWWMPVLFMRLKSGRIWYAPGFATAQDMDKWPALLSSIHQKRCIPVLGPA